jgi:uncharacterized protein YjdB
MMTRVRPPRRAPLAALVGALTLGAACGGSTDPGAAPVDAVVLSDTAVVLRVGGEAALAARARRAGGDDLVGRRIFWSTRDPAIVEVTQAGVVRALAVGSTEVAASVEGEGALARVTVLARPVTTVQVEPATLQLTVNARQRLTARTLNDAGVEAAAPVTWTTLTPDVVTVSADGEVTAVALGTGSVRAAVEGATGTATVVVTPIPVTRVAITPVSPSVAAGATLQLTATPTDAGGAPLAGRAVSWSSRDPGVATVSSAGQVAGVSAGTATIVATTEGVTGTVVVRVGAPAPTVASVEVAPSTRTLSVGDTLTFAATARAADRTTISGRAVAWSSGGPSVISVSPAGVVRAEAPGTAQVLARVDGITGAATVTVPSPPPPPPPPPAVTVQVRPAQVTVRDRGSNRTAQLDATDQAGRSLPAGEVTWQSSNPLVATVDNRGLVRGVSSGSGTATAEVTATYRGVSAKATVIVTR